MKAVYWMEKITNFFRPIYNRRNEDICKKPYKHEENTIKIVTDEPARRGVLDFPEYSRVFSKIIVNSPARFSIGIFGDWGTGKTTLMKMIEARLKGYVFSWDDIPGNDNSLKSYLRDNFDNVDWIENKQFVKSEDNIISIHNDANSSISITIDRNTNSVLISVNGIQFNNQLFIKNEKKD